jgi:hypothetical protein
VSDTAIVTDEKITIILPKNISIGVLASDESDAPAFVIIHFNESSKGFGFGDTTDATRALAIMAFRCADEADRVNGVFSPKKTENALRKYLAEMKAKR